VPKGKRRFFIFLRAASAGPNCITRECKHLAKATQQSFSTPPIFSEKISGTRMFLYIFKGSLRIHTNKQTPERADCQNDGDKKIRECAAGGWKINSK
jgi:hypothetical protein